MSDVVVIGGGAAGVMAAAAAREGGASVTLVQRAPGASAVSSGAIDLAGDPDLVPGRAMEENPSLQENLAAQLTHNPWHPFHQMAADYDAAEAKAGHLLRGLEVASKLLSERGGLSLEGDGKENRACLTPLGTFKFTALSQASGFSADELRAMRPVFVGFAGLPGTVPARQAVVFDHVRGAEEGTSASLELPLAEAIGPNANAIGLATLFDDEAYTRAVAEKVGATLSGEFSHVVMPPVLGIYNPARTRAVFCEVLGIEVIETLAVPPSAPGVRLDLALRCIAESLEIELLSAEVTGAETARGSVQMLRVLTASGEEKKLKAARFVLAGGKFIGGGVEKEGALREPLFGLPVFWKNRHFVSTTNEEIFDRRFLRSHAAFCSGLRVDEKMRPVRESGHCVYDNLHSAGSVLGGYDAVAGPGGLGVALVGGYIAGQHAGGPQ